MLFPHYLGLLHHTEQALADSLRTAGAGHAAEADVFHTTGQLAAQCDDHVRLLRPVLARYGEAPGEGPERMHVEPITEVRSGGLGLLRDLHELYALVSLTQSTWTVVGQAAQGLRDPDLRGVVAHCALETAGHLAWLTTRIKAAAPQALIVAT